MKSFNRCWTFQVWWDQSHIKMKVLLLFWKRSILFSVWVACSQWVSAGSRFLVPPLLRVQRRVCVFLNQLRLCGAQTSDIIYYSNIPLLFWACRTYAVISQDKTEPYREAKRGSAHWLHTDAVIVNETTQLPWQISQWKLWFNKC